MNLVNKIKKLAHQLDSVNIDMGVVQALDSDKLLKLYNVLSQLTMIIESDGQFRQMLVKELVDELDTLSNN